MTVGLFSVLQRWTKSSCSDTDCLSAVSTLPQFISTEPNSPPGGRWLWPRRSCPTCWASSQRRLAPTPSRASPPTFTTTSVRRSTSGWARFWWCSSSSRTCYPAPRSGSLPSTCCGRCTEPSRWPRTRLLRSSLTCWTPHLPGRSPRRCCQVGPCVCVRFRT